MHFVILVQAYPQFQILYLITELRLQLADS
jgi:hypothetical protein